jgi:hypothetical protein
MNRVRNRDAVSLSKTARMVRETFCEAAPVARSERSGLLPMSTHRSERWRIAARLACQARCFFSTAPQTLSFSL